MINTKNRVASSEVEHGSSRVLYVEGEEKSIDDILMSSIFTTIKVKAIGSSSNIRATAEAFSKVDPAAFFVIDRDHYKDEEVEKTWNNFKAGLGNLIIWRKKEIENYFLNPSLLCSSEFVKRGVTEERIQECIVDYAKEHIYRFVANRVIIALREELKCNWIRLYSTSKDFPNAKAALDQLLNNDKIKNKPKKVTKFFSQVGTRFEEELSLMVGEGEDLRWGKGRWVDLMPGKKVLRKVLNSSNFFDVRDKHGERVAEKLLHKEILKRLLRKEENWPEDFKQLNTLVNSRK